MSDKGKFGEPWTECGAPDCSCRLVWCRHDDVVLGRFYTAADNEGEGYTPERALANMRRAIACVNALDGLDPGELAGFIRASRDRHDYATLLSRQAHHPEPVPPDRRGNTSEEFDAALAQLDTPHSAVRDPQSVGGEDEARGVAGLTIPQPTEEDEAG